MEKIIIPFDGKNYSDILNAPTVTTISFDELKPAIENLIRLRPGEIIDGIIINESGGIDVKLHTALQRRTYKKRKSSE